jgi:type I restriction enzyme S subunit
VTEWSKVRLHEVAELRGGYAFKSSEYVSSGDFVLRTLNIAPDGSINQHDAVYVDPSRRSEFRQFILESGDTLFVMVGATLGKCGLVRDRDLPALLNQNMWRIRPDKAMVDPLFFYYLFVIESQKRLAYASGAARDFVRRDDYRQLELLLPPMDVQRAIAEVLGALDDKIESNQRIVRATQELARAELRKAVATSSEIVPVSELLDQVQDRVPSPRSELPYVGLEHFTGFDLALWNFGKSSNSKTATKLASCGDLLFGRIRPYFGNVAITGKSAVVAQSIEVLRPKQVEFSEIAYLSVSSSDFINTAVLYSSGTTMPQVKWTDLKSERVEVPTRQVAQKFHLVAAPLLGVIRQLPLESANLRLLRDTLLPELLSGRLRVRDAEKVVKEVV